MEKYTIPELTSDVEWLHITGQAKAPIKQSFHPIKPKQVAVEESYNCKLVAKLYYCSTNLY